MFSESAAAGYESKSPNWLSDSSVCNILDEKVKAVWLRHEVKSERAEARPISYTAYGSVCTIKEEMDQLVAHCI